MALVPDRPLCYAPAVTEETANAHRLLRLILRPRANTSQALHTPHGEVLEQVSEGLRLLHELRM